MASSTPKPIFDTLAEINEAPPSLKGLASLADEIYVMRGSPAVLEKIPIHDLDLLKPRELVPELLAKQANILEMLSDSSLP